MSQPVEMPEPRQKYKFHELTVGDWIEVDDEKLRNSAASSAWQFGKRHKKTFASRLGDDGIFRIFRMA